MAIRFVTLDCAGTLVDVDWRPAVFAADCAEEVGVPLDRPTAESIYTRLLQTRWTTYRQLNMTRDPEICDGFWKELTKDWMAEAEIDAEWLDPILIKAWEGLYGPDGRVFKLFPDSLPALTALRELGLELAALSNWDYSLHRVVAQLGLRPHLREVVASLEEGVEKPDKRLFEIVLDRLGAQPGEVLHVGDHPIDDVQGALAAGLRAVLLDRRPSAKPSWGRELALRITKLTQLPEVLACIG